MSDTENPVVSYKLHNCSTPHITSGDERKAYWRCPRCDAEWVYDKRDRVENHEMLTTVSCRRHWWSLRPTRNMQLVPTKVTVSEWKWSRGGEWPSYRGRMMRYEYRDREWVFTGFKGDHESG